MWIEVSRKSGAEMNQKQAEERRRQKLGSNWAATGQEEKGNKRAESGQEDCGWACV
jgi:hypothetical protein